MTENTKLEELLQKSFTEPSVRPEFIKTLLSSTIYVVAKRDDTKEVNGSRYEKLNFMNITNKDGEYAIPFFTSKEMVDVVAPGTPYIVELPCLNFLEGINKANVVLNPNTKSARYFKTEEIQFILGLKQIGDAGNDTSNGTKISVRVLKNFPKELAGIIAEFLKTIDYVNAAFLLEIEYEGRPAHPLLIVDFIGSKEELYPQIGKVTEPYLLKEHSFIDIMSYKDNSINQNVMQKATPIYFRHIEEEKK